MNSPAHARGHNASRSAAHSEAHRRLLARVRRVFLSVAWLWAVLLAVALALTGASRPLATTVGVAALLALCVLWFYGYRRGDFPPVTAGAEFATLAIAGAAVGGLETAPGLLFVGLVYLGLLFRALYGPATRVVLAVLTYLAAWFVGWVLAPGAPAADLLSPLPLEQVLGLVAAAAVGYALLVLIGRGDDLVEERFRSLVQNSLDIIAVVGPDGTTRYASPSIRRVLGYRAEDRTGESALDLVHPEDVERVRGTLDDLVAAPTGATVAAEFRMYHADGTFRHAEALATNLIDDPAIGGIVVNYRDVTRRREYEKALRESEERFRTAFEDAPVGVALIGLDRRYLRANRALCGMLGYSEEDLRTRTSADLTHPEDLDESVDRAIRVMGGAGSQSTEKRYVCKDGRVVWTQSSVSLVRDAEGEPSHFIALYQDITDRKQAEEKLRETETRYRSLVETIPAITYVDDLDEISTATYISPQIVSVLGFTAEERLADPELWAERLHPEDHEDVLAQNARSNETGEAFDMEYRMVRKDGRTVWVRDASVVVRDEEGRLSYRQGVMFDVTDRRQTEEALKASEARLRTVIEQSPLGIHIFAPDGASLLTNDAWDELWHLDEEESSRDANIFEDELLRAAGLLGYVERSVDGTAVETPPLQFDPAVVGREGAARWLRALIYPVRDEGGGLREVTLLLEDVTERKEAENRLEQAEQGYRLLVEQVPAVVYLDGVDANNRAIYRSSHVREVLGYEPEEFLEDPKFWHRLLHPDDRQRVLEENERTNRTGGPFKIEYRMVRRDGRVVWLRDEAVLIRDAEGRPLHWQGVFMDITERRSAEDRVRFQAQLLEQVQAGVIATDMEGTVIHWNKHAETMYGWSRGEALGREVGDLVVGPTEAEMADGVMARLRAGESWEGEFAVRRRDGSVFPAYVSDSLVRDAEGRAIGIVGVSTDLTERKRAEETLRQSEERYRAVVERTTDGIFLADFATKRIFETNAALQGMLGYTAEELSGMSAYDVVVDEPENIDRNARRVLGEGDLLLGERRYRRKDGSVLYVESSVTRIPYAGGEVSCCIVRDITARKRAEDEIREANRRLVELAVLKADFTAMVAHELDTPLAVIRGYADMVSTGELDAGGLRQAISRIQSETDVLNALVADVRTTAAVERQDFAVDPRPVPVDDLLADAAAFASSLPGDHELVVRAAAAGAVRADRYRIGQVLRNLLSNAAKYSPDGSSISLRVFPGENGRVRFEVFDRGGGISPEDAARIFEKFGRGREGRDQKGLGLGLYLSRRILQTHGGELTFRPDPEGGAVFGFELEAAG